MDIILVVILLTVTICSYCYVVKVFKKYNKIDAKSLLSGFEVSRKIIDRFDLSNIYITESRIAMFGNYDFKRKVIRLSKSYFNNTSLTSCVVSAKESVKAIQDKLKSKSYIFMSNAKPICDFICYVGYLIIAIGLLFGHIRTLRIGMGFELLVIIFYLLTFSIEKNNCNFALEQLIDNKIITKNEVGKVKELLNASMYINFASIIFPIVELLKRIIEFGDSSK